MPRDMVVERLEKLATDARRVGGRLGTIGFLPPPGLERAVHEIAKGERVELERVLVVAREPEARIPLEEEQVRALHVARESGDRDAIDPRLRDRGRDGECERTAGRRDASVGRGPLDRGPLDRHARSLRSRAARRRVAGRVFAGQEHDAAREGLAVGSGREEEPRRTQRVARGILPPDDERDGTAPPGPTREHAVEDPRIPRDATPRGWQAHRFAQGVGKQRITTDRLRDDALVHPDDHEIGLVRDAGVEPAEDRNPVASGLVAHDARAEPREDHRDRLGERRLRRAGRGDGGEFGERLVERADRTLPLVDHAHAVVGGALADDAREQPADHRRPRLRGTPGTRRLATTVVTPSATIRDRSIEEIDRPSAQPLESRVRARRREGGRHTVVDRLARAGRAVPRHGVGSIVDALRRKPHADIGVPDERGERLERGRAGRPRLEQPFESDEELADARLGEGALDGGRERHTPADELVVEPTPRRPVSHDEGDPVAPPRNREPSDRADRLRGLLGWRPGAEDRPGGKHGFGKRPPRPVVDDGESLAIELAPTRFERPMDADLDRDPLHLEGSQYGAVDRFGVREEDDHPSESRCDDRRRGIGDRAIGVHRERPHDRGLARRADHGVPRRQFDEA